MNRILNRLGFRAAPGVVERAGGPHPQRDRGRRGRDADNVREVPVAPVAGQVADGADRVADAKVRSGDERASADGPRARVRADHPRPEAGERAVRGVRARRVRRRRIDEAEVRPPAPRRRDPREDLEAVRGRRGQGDADEERGRVCAILTASLVRNEYFDGVFLGSVTGSLRRDERDGSERSCDHALFFFFALTKSFELFGGC